MVMVVIMTGVRCGADGMIMCVTCTFSVVVVISISISHTNMYVYACV